jgi:hypothetical protein
MFAIPLKPALAAALLLSLVPSYSAPALADTVSFMTALSGATEVPPNDSKASGTLNASLDTSTKVLSWTIEYSGLTGPATAAHFHGPADAGRNAPPVLPIDGSLDSPLKGTATLSDEQATDLQAGKWYFNVHSAAYPNGEIRGQLKK